jgi:replicative DNA helicase
MNGSSSDRLPPQNRDAERGVLGGMIRDNNVIGDVVQIVREENFYADAHQKIFRAVTSLYNDGKPADLITIGEYLHQNKFVEDIGGYGYLAELWDAAPTAANAEYYAKIVRDKAIVRNLIHAGNEILRDSYNQNAPADDLLGNAERKIMDIAEWGVTGETVTLEQTLNEVYDRIDARTGKDHTALSGLGTGWTDLDELTNGLQESELVIVAARPSMGKTAFCLNLVRNIAFDEGAPVFFVSLEQSRLELAERLLCMQARVDSHRLRKGNLGQNSEEMRRIIQAGGELKEHAKVFIDDSPGQSMLRIAANARRLKLRQKIRMVVVDYLQLVEPDNRRDSRQEQVANISRRLKFLAKELKIPVIACAQLNRGPEDRENKEPRLSDLRESGSIEQDADTVMMLHRPEYYDPNDSPGVTKIIISKQRNGPTGDINLTFLKQFMRFENFAAESHFGGGASY